MGIVCDAADTSRRSSAAGRGTCRPTTTALVAAPAIAATALGVIALRN